MPKATARRATSRPTWPKPSMAMVLPANSTPRNLPRSHSPSLREAVACGMCRARAATMANVCSAVERELPPGVFMTMTPWRVAASMSMLSKPVPARPITLRREAAASTSAVTLVALRTTSPS